MARMVMGNAFSLLDDEEGDDNVMVVVDCLVKKADREAQSSQADEDSQSTDDWGKYTGGGHGEVFYEDTESKNAKEDVNGSDENQAENDDGGDWQEVSKPKGKSSVNQEHINGNSQRSYKNGNGNGNGNSSGERIFHQRNLKGSVKEGGKFGDEEKTNRNGNSNNNGNEKRGYGGANRGRNRGGGFRRTDNGEVRVHAENSGDGNNGNEKRGNGRYNGRSRGEYQRMDNGEVRRTDENGGDVNNVDEDRTYRNGNKTYGSERRGYGENRRRGRGGYQRNDNGEERKTGNAAAVENNADADHLNGSSGGDAAAAVSEVSGDAETEGKKMSEEINGGTSDSKWKPERKLTKEQEARKKEREEYKQKKMEEEEQDAGLMTLAQYEKKLSEKRKALESMKAEERKVTIDKDLEHMRPVEKKQDDIFFEPISEEKSEEELKKKDSRNKEKGRKAVAVDVAEFLKPASYRGGGGDGGGGGRGRGQGRGRGRGQGRGGAGGRGGYRGGYPATTRDGHTNNDAHRMGNATTAAVSDSILEDKDFPVLGVAEKI